jgi:hypothetical protein
MFVVQVGHEFVPSCFDCALYLVVVEYWPERAPDQLKPRMITKTVKVTVNVKSLITAFFSFDSK